MICLTGDVHHMGLNTKDQRYLGGTELDAGIKYLEICKQYGLKATLFITGKCFKEEPKKIDKLLQFANLEIGGHNYFAFKPRLPFKISNRVFGVKNGPYAYQNWEVRKTLQIISQNIVTRVVSWRNHGYRHDRNTLAILKKNGIRFYSDHLDPDAVKPYKENDMIIVPINVLPDHDFIYHGALTRGSIDESVLLNSPFQSSGCTIGQWLGRLKEMVLRVEDNQGLSTLLIHPACMEISDGFETFEKACQFLSRYANIWMNEAHLLVDSQ